MIYKTFHTYFSPSKNFFPKDSAKSGIDASLKYKIKLNITYNINRMNDIFTTTKNILKDIFDNELNIDKPNLSETAIDFIIRHYTQAVNKQLKKDFFDKEKLIKQALKKTYNLFIKEGAHDISPAILKYKIKDLKPAFRKELEKAMNNALSLVKTQDIAFLNKVKNNLLNYCSNTQLKRTQYLFFDNVLPTNNNNKYQKMIVRDMQKKMVGNMAYITATRNNAIGFIWKNRKDIRVVGNPAGLYPKGNSKHNNHWNREGKLYLFKDSSFIKNGLIKKNNKVEWAEDIPDGLPSQAINCRCTMRIIYRLYEIPNQYKSIITKKGLTKID